MPNWVWKTANSWVIVHSYQLALNKFLIRALPLSSMRNIDKKIIIIIIRAMEIVESGAGGTQLQPPAIWLVLIILNPTWEFRIMWIRSLLPYKDQWSSGTPQSWIWPNTEYIRWWRISEYRIVFVHEIFSNTESQIYLFMKNFQIPNTE